jgi:hypothetical protein
VTDSAPGSGGPRHNRRGSDRGAFRGISFIGDDGLGLDCNRGPCCRFDDGLTGGNFNFAANLADILTPLGIGVILVVTGSFPWAMAYVALVALIGALSYMFLLGQMKQIDLSGLAA